MYVKLEDTVRDFKQLVEGEFDDLPEQAFYMVGTMQEAKQKAQKLAAEGYYERLVHTARSYSNGPSS